jgi:hypothetical protein
LQVVASKPPLEELELELEEEVQPPLELEELVLLPVPELDELLVELLLELIVPAEAVSVTLSSLAPSSRLSILSV